MPKVKKLPRTDDAQSFMDEFGDNLRRLREKKDFTLEGFGKQVGLSRSTISGIETGQREFLSSYFTRYAKALEVDVTELMPHNGHAPH